VPDWELATTTTTTTKTKTKNTILNAGKGMMRNKITMMIKKTMMLMMNNLVVVAAEPRVVTVTRITDLHRLPLRTPMAVNVSVIPSSTMKFR